MKRFHAARLTSCLAVAAVGAAIFATVNPGASNAEPLVPWLDKPVAVQAATTTANAAGLPACSTSDLAVRQARHGIVSLGTYAYIYTATSTSSRPCYISGYPAVRVAGKALEHGANELSVNPGTLRPGASATFAILQTRSRVCGNPAARHASAEAASIVIGGAGTPLAGSVFPSDCTMTTVSPIGLPLMAPSGPDPLASLTVALGSVTAARAGQTVTFTISLSNPTGEAIRVPYTTSYEMGISSARAAAYRLNPARPIIQAHSSVTYQMRYYVPAATPAGIAKIGWFLLNPARTGVGGVITITH